MHRKWYAYKNLQYSDVNNAHHDLVSSCSNNGNYSSKQESRSVTCKHSDRNRRMAVRLPSAINKASASAEVDDPCAVITGRVTARFISSTVSLTSPARPAASLTRCYLWDVLSPSSALDWRLPIYFILTVHIFITRHSLKKAHFFEKKVRSRTKFKSQICIGTIIQLLISYLLSNFKLNILFLTRYSEISERSTTEIFMF